MNPDWSARRDLSINQATVPRWSASEVIEGCARAGYAGVGLWRDRVQAEGPGLLAKRARTLGVEVTSLCRGGFFLAPTTEGTKARIEDNLRAVDEAAELGAAVLALVCGPAPGRDLAGARQAVAAAIAELAAYAATAGIALGIEPLHPLYCGDRSVVVTLPQALHMARCAGKGTVGLVLDSYHLWWDPELERNISQAASAVLLVQLADWLAPPPDPLNGRGMLGDGCIDLRAFCRTVRSAGYAGKFEVEIFNPEVWALDPADTLEVVALRYEEHAR
ncbi:MAG: sugar phosphate isomerase/epimerase family protein [Acidimicrobiales bacterium]|jgi:sugar phosphate isomerase/epimerase